MKSRGMPLKIYNASDSDITFDRCGKRLLEVFHRHQSRSSRGLRGREFGLQESLHDAMLLLVEFVVHLNNLLERETVSEDQGGIESSARDFLQAVIPVSLNWRLTASNESDAHFHDSADEESVTGASVVGN